MRLSTNSWVHFPLLIVLLLAFVALAGCMDGGDAAELRFDDHSELGSILVDGDGMTLYIFTNDGPGESTCFDECAENWPPLLADEVPDASDGLEERLSLIDRNGTMQVAHDDRPLYYFAADQGPGAANGQGRGDVWFVVEEMG